MRLIIDHMGKACTPPQGAVKDRPLKGMRFQVGYNQLPIYYLYLQVVRMS